MSGNSFGQFFPAEKNLFRKIVLNKKKVKLRAALKLI